MIKSKLYLAFLLSLLILGCENSTDPKDNSGTFTVSGTIENKNGTTLSDDVSVYVLWTVSAGSPDYTYVWGKGTLDKDKMTFKVELPNNPPEEALNLKTVGVGQIFLLNDKSLQEGRLPIQYDRSKFVGVAAWYAIIYKENESSDSEMDWLPLFTKGYNIGVGVERPGTFDSFKPITNETIKLIIDDILNIKFVNWT